MANARHSAIAALVDEGERLEPSDQSIQGTFDHEPGLIPKVNFRGVKRGDISPLLHKVPALVLEGDNRIDALVASTLEWLGLDEESARRGAPAFDNIFDLARNHREGNTRVGDMLRFVPKLFGHVARKFLVYPGAGDNSLKTFPEAFYSGTQLVPVPRQIAESGWNLISEVLESTLPAAARGFAYAVEVDVLVYPTSSSHVDRVSALLADGSLLADSAGSAGFWSRLGHRIDARKNHAAGVFQTKGIKDLFAILSLVPGLSRLTEAMNDKISAGQEGATPKDFHMMAPSHVDRTRYVTGLMGRRANLDTQVLWGDRWISLPVTEKSIAIFPSARISSVSDIPATRHRVLVHEPPSRASTAGSRNVTVSLAVVDLHPNLIRD